MRKNTMLKASVPFSCKNIFTVLILIILLISPLSAQQTIHVEGKPGTLVATNIDQRPYVDLAPGTYITSVSGSGIKLWSKQENPFKYIVLWEANATGHHLITEGVIQSITFNQSPYTRVYAFLIDVNNVDSSGELDVKFMSGSTTKTLKVNGYQGTLVSPQISQMPYVDLVPGNYKASVSGEGLRLWWAQNDPFKYVLLWEGNATGHHFVYDGYNFDITVDQSPYTRMFAFLIDVNNSDSWGSLDVNFQQNETSELKVTSPNSSSNWNAGSSYTINWESTGAVGNYVQIRLYRNGYFMETIISSTANDGSYSWQIPGTYATSSGYQIRITSTTTSADDYSDYFTIKPEVKNITVLKPNGGEVLNYGDSYSISWNSNAGGNVKIELTKNGSLYSSIINSTANNGSYSWNILNSYEESNQYKIKISSTSDATITDESDNYFTIGTIPPPPSGGINLVADSRSVGPGQEFWIDVTVGSSSNPVSDLKVISFTLKYTSTNICDYVSNQLGTFPSNAQVTVIPDDNNGEINASIYKLTGGDTGYGVVLRLQFKVSANAQQDQTICFSFDEVQANDSNGSEIKLNPGSLCMEIGAYENVWPGDANNNGKVDIFDINSIIQYYGKTGYPRTNPSSNWSAQQCQPWNPVEATHADCNGNGKVDIFDINYVVINFGKTHSALTKIMSHHNLKSVNETYPIYINERYYDLSNGELWLDIQVGSQEYPVADLKVVSFELNYPQSSDVDYVSYEIGSFITGANATVLPDDSNGKVSASVYRFEGGNSGYGVVLSLKFKVNSNYKIDDFEFGDVQANDANGSEIILRSAIFVYTDTSNSDQMAKSYLLFQNFPNPFNPTTEIKYSLPHSTFAEVNIYNTLGQKIKTIIAEFQQAGQHTVNWNATDYLGNNVGSGIYYYELKTSNFKQIKKMLLLR